MVKIADYIEAPNSGGDYRKVLLVVHVTVSPETQGAARGIVAYWNRARTGSTQYVVDNREIIQAVPETAYAWAAGTTANKWGIHVEHVGYIQTLRQWRDGYSSAELDLSAPLFAELGEKYGIPLRRLSVEQVRRAVRSGDPADGGICGHYDITRAFPGETSHTDPGRHFPWDRFMRLVHAASNGDTARFTEGDDMPSPEDLWNHRLPTINMEVKTLKAQTMLAQAHNRAGGAREAANEAVRGVGDLARLIGDATLSDQERKVLANEIAERTAKAVERLDAAAVADQLDITVKGDQ